MQNASAFFGIAILVSGAALAGIACGKGRTEFRGTDETPPLDAGRRGHRPRVQADGELLA